MHLRYTLCEYANHRPARQLYVDPLRYPQALFYFEAHRQWGLLTVLIHRERNCRLPL
jgi:hypothetical protein